MMCNPLHGWANETDSATGWSCSSQCLTPPDCPPYPPRNMTNPMHGPQCVCARANRTAGRVNRGYAAQHVPEHHEVPRPPQCSNYSMYFGTCFNATGVVAEVKVDWSKHENAEAQCCDACGSEPECREWSLRHRNGSAVCELHSKARHAKGYGQEECTNAVHRNPHPPKRPDGPSGGGSDKRHYQNWGSVERKLGGYWYSFTQGGRCTGAAEPGDGSGCTWKQGKLLRMINSTCLGKLVDGSVYKAGADCFAACPDPTNKTSTCADDCYLTTLVGDQQKNTTGMTAAEILRPWTEAFGAGPSACPDLQQLQQETFAATRQVER